MTGLVGVAVLVGVLVGVGVTVGVLVGVLVAVGVGVTVRVGVELTIGVMVGVAVGDWQKVDTETIPTLPPPETSSSKVSNNPLVFTWVDAPALSWKLLLAIGVPFSKSVQVPELVMSVPMLVIVKIPCASGVQFADREKTGKAG